MDQAKNSVFAGLWVKAAPVCFILYVLGFLDRPKGKSETADCVGLILTGYDSTV